MLDVHAPGMGALSPDGKALYFSWRVTGVSQLWRLDGPMRFPVQLTAGQDPTWLAAVTPDGKALVVSRDRKGEENPGLYLQDPAGGQLSLIQHKAGIRTRLQLVSDEGRWVYYSSNDKKPDSYALYRYDRTSGRAEELLSQDGIWSIADRKPGRLLLSKAVGSNMEEYYELDEASRALTTLFGQGEREDYSALYGPGDGEVLVKTPRFGDFRRLYSWRAGTFTALTPELGYDVEDFGVDRPRRRVLYTVNEGGFTRARALDPRTRRDLTVPGLPRDAVHAYWGSTTPDGRFTTLGVDSGAAPLSSYALDWKTGTLTRWHTGSAPEADLARFVPATLETYPARDGTAIPVLVREPKTCAKPCPVLVRFHGGPESQSKPGFSPVDQLFLDAGFVIAEPNVRGSDGYGKAWIHADDGPKRLDVITDIEDAAAWARKRFAAEGGPPKVGVMGGSYGGYSTLMAMTYFAGAYDAGAEVVGMSSLVTFLKNTAPYRRILRESEYGSLAHDLDALTKLSPSTYLDRLKGPLLIIQGASDPRVPVGEAVQFHDALKSRGVDSDILVFADEGHGAQKRENKVYQLGYILRFFQKHLQGKG
ncbi:MAG: S9 family peptidase [Elusimicrobia bacterium]|nr:S9 family peptidase [Elusimicrobiota bacterium]